jgi:tetratricopeptide (TPR) repeat protein
MASQDTTPSSGLGHTAGRGSELQRPRPTELVEVIERELRFFAIIQNRVQHAQNIKGGRPIPRLSPIEYKRAWSDSDLPNIRAFAPEAVFYTIHNNRFPSTDPEVLNLPWDAYWFTALPGDSVLLSDQVTHHYTNIAAIDHEAGSVDFLDRWPDILTEFVGASPQLFDARSGPFSGATLVRFTREEFERLFFAAIVLDIGTYPLWLEKTLPAALWTPELQAALARSLLHASRNHGFPVQAADLIIGAIRQANRDGNTAFVEQSLPIMMVAVELSRWTLLAQGNTERAERAMRYLSELVDRYGSAPIDGTDANDVINIAFAAARVAPLEALKYLEVAIKKDPSNQQAYLLRAEVNSTILRSYPQGDRNLAIRVSQEGIGDVDKALRSLDAKKEEIVRRRSDYLHDRGIYWERGETAMKEDAQEAQGIFPERVLALRLRGALRLFSGDLEGSKADGLELISLDPESPDGYEIAGEAEGLLGNSEASRKLLSSTLVRQPSERRWRISPIAPTAGSSPAPTS